MKAKTKRWTVAARMVSLVFLSTCASVNCTAQAAKVSKKSGPRQAQNSGDAAEAKRIIRASLIDPTSAQFEVAPPRIVLTDEGSKTSLVCGTYNAKNRFGGYAGRIYFAYSKSARAVFTSNVARLEANGSSQSLSAIGDSLRGTPSMDQISAVHEQGSTLQKQVKFWLGQCES